MCHCGRGFQLAAMDLLYIPYDRQDSYFLFQPVLHNLCNKYCALLFVRPVVEHWLEQEITQWVYHECMLYHGATSPSFLLFKICLLYRFLGCIIFYMPNCMNVFIMKTRRKEVNILFNNTLNTFCIYGYKVCDVVKIVREETHRCRYMGYWF